MSEPYWQAVDPSTWAAVTYAASRSLPPPASFPGADRIGRELDQAWREMEEIVPSEDEVLALTIDGPGNPYLDLFLRLSGGRYDFEWSPGLTFDHVHESRTQYARRRVVDFFAWAIPDERALDLVGSGPVVEIGAGGGYWAAMLRARGVDVAAFDLTPERNHWVKRSWTHVARGGAPRAGMYGDRTLLLCWPPYKSLMARSALTAHAVAGGRRVVYVGEMEGGCCASDSFFARLERDYDQVAEHSIPKWPCIHDYLTVWERR